MTRSGLCRDVISMGMNKMIDNNITKANENKKYQCEGSEGEDCSCDDDEHDCNCDEHRH